MIDINPLVLLVAAVLGVIVGGAWNSTMLFGAVRDMPVSPPASGAGFPALQLLLELTRQLVLAIAFTWAATRMGVRGVGETALMGLLIWAGFQAALLAGGVIWKEMTPRTYLVHAGDALVKALLMTAIIGWWR